MARRAAVSVREPERMGRITAIAMQMHRNTPREQAAMGAAGAADAGRESAQHRVGGVFGRSPTARAFDAHRFIHWRYFWDYFRRQRLRKHEPATGVLVQGAAICRFRESATMDGGIYLWKDGRETPDTMSVSLEQPEEMLVSWVLRIRQ